MQISNIHQFVISMPPHRHIPHSFVVYFCCVWDRVRDGAVKLMDINIRHIKTQGADIHHRQPVLGGGHNS